MTLLVRLAAAAIVLVLGASVAVAQSTLVRSVFVRSGYATDGLFVMLVIGSDEGPPHRPADPLTARADGIHLVVVDTGTPARMTIVDVPRDSYIGGAKVNAHLAYGGPDRLVGAIEAWSGLDVDRWALATFRSIENIADGLGGISVEVPVPMHDRFSGTQLEPGLQDLPGWQALAFVRDRKSMPDGDVGRARNQGRLLIAALAQIRGQVADPGALADVTALVARNVVTDVPPEEMLPLALLAMRIEPTAVEHVTLSGPIGFVGAESVLYPQTGDLFQRLAAGQVGPPQ